MEQRKLKFALFGNIYQTKKSTSIQKVLSCLSEHGAELVVDMEYYYFLKDNQRIDVNASPPSFNSYVYVLVSDEAVSLSPIPKG